VFGWNLFSSTEYYFVLKKTRCRSGASTAAAVVVAVVAGTKPLKVMEIQTEPK
jgi:hypothetical protein